MQQSAREQNVDLALFGHKLVNFDVSTFAVDFDLLCQLWQGSRSTVGQMWPPRGRRIKDPSISFSSGEVQWTKSSRVDLAGRFCTRGLTYELQDLNQGMLRLVKSFSASEVVD